MWLFLLCLAPMSGGRGRPWGSERASHRRDGRWSGTRPLFVIVLSLICFVVGFNNDTVDFVCFTLIIVLEIINNKKRLKYYVFSSVYLAPSPATETKCNETSLAKERLRGDVYQIFSWSLSKKSKQIK